MFLYSLISVVLGTGACSSDPATPLEAHAPSYSLLGAVNTLLLNCKPLSYSKTTAIIGTAGGTLRFGPHTLVVPSGALQSNVKITAEVVSDNVNSVRFSPEGLQFAKNAALTLSYSNCFGAGMLLPKKVAYTSELLSILEVLTSTDFPGPQKVTGKLKHFSRYAVAY
jgi:hypothetical protein